MLSDDRSCFKEPFLFNFGIKRPSRKWSSLIETEFGPKDVHL